MPKSTLYVKDLAEFNQLKHEAQLKWYSVNNEYLSTCDIVIKALQLLIKDLESKGSKSDCSGQDIHPLR